MQTKYHALRVVSFLFRLLGWLSVALATIAIILAALDFSTQRTTATGALNAHTVIQPERRADSLLLPASLGRHPAKVLVTAVVILVNGFLWIAIGELILVAVDIEANTRLTRDLLRRRAD